MTAKKMADIFFGKFSELISSQSASNEINKNDETKNQKNEKPKIINKIINKKFIYLSLLVLLIVLGYFII